MPDIPVEEVPLGTEVFVMAMPADGLIDIWAETKTPLGSVHFRVTLVVVKASNVIELTSTLAGPVMVEQNMCTTVKDLVTSTNQCLCLLVDCIAH
jgi:hypothetical protein